jgi:GNAT superfamily N-acetyltransferase
VSEPVSDLTVRPEPWGSPVAEALVTELGLDLNERYGNTGDDGKVDATLAEVTAASVTPPAGVFLVAWAGDEVVGCGAIRPSGFEATCEIKRMYVRPSARGRGVSRAVLAALEGAAVELGYRRVILETGIKQPEAIALYLSTGYTAIDAYGAYRASPLSRCYERLL